MTISINVETIDGGTEVHPLIVSMTVLSEVLLESLLEHGSKCLEWQAEFAATECLGHVLGELGLLEFPSEEFFSVFSDTIDYEWCLQALALAGDSIENNTADFMYEVARFANNRYVNIIKELGGN